MSPRSLAIATPVGSFKGAFAHGVLTALERAGVRADAYAAASSSVIPASWASLGWSAELGSRYWLAGWEALQLPNQNMSKVMQRGIRSFSRMLRPALFEPSAPALYIATNAVITEEAIALTQTDRAKELGKKLMLASAAKDRRWVDTHLRFQMFSTHSVGGASQNQNWPQYAITANNYPAVAYASSRIMHAWDLPAWIDGCPFVDAAYTCLCPAMAMAAAGYQEVIAISNEPGPLYQDMFHLSTVPNSWQNSKIHIIRPHVHLREMGVDFTKASPAGLVQVYQYGQECGWEFMENWRSSCSKGISEPTPSVSVSRSVGCAESKVK
jgi:hypothetical protein